MDFETEAIVKGSPIPPKPVGIALKVRDKPGKYYAWGHPTKNNSTLREAMDETQNLCWSSENTVFHNAKFDIAVMKHHFDMEPHGFIDDTMILAFLVNPHSKTLKLKELSEFYLDRPPIEQDDLRDWILANVKRSTEKNWGEFICLAPGDLVGRYAVADVDMTAALYKKLHKVLEEDHEKFA